MPDDKINEFLDAGDSDDDVGRASDSEDDLRKGGRSAKRRRVDDDESDVDDFSDGGEDDNDGENDASQNGEASHAGEGDEPKQRKKGANETELPGVTKPLTKKNLVATEAAIKKSGVVYVSRIPPYMNPGKLRSLLEPYGKINRLFLAPEDPAARTRRIKSGGNKKRNFTEGWVEFVRKKDAKKACELLNAQTIGGKKGTYYRDDIWNLLYLSGFKWHNLTEQISAENAERASRMRAEISKSTKENKEFVRNVERGKMLDGIQSKAAAKKKKVSNDEDTPEKPTSEAQEETTKGRKRTFAQVPLAKKRRFDEGQPEEVQRVLSKIF
ncbi:RNA-binding ATPase activator esf2 [Podospora aff. communis PSN243]|uniref:18S rRNA factor 2 n=1 Tax=Podospora aff. communis PSN243 TaxID=3040156 RepID=A0AAV9H1D0_9PEZI|nr:RNA-binding ATPase activator esf2 [Podospora aff. communis PSN243]